MMRRIICTVAVVLCLAASQAHAAIYGFTGLTNTNVNNTQNGQAQLSVEVLANGSLVDFIFRNIGLNACSITDVYFDDDILLSFGSIVNGPGVLFSHNATPPNLPGANLASPPFVTTTGLSADSNAPVQPNGVNPGEMLTIRMALLGSNMFADVISDLASRDLRIGIHVQGFANGGSESFIGNPNPGVVPAPGALVLGVVGMACLRRVRRVA